MVVIIARYDVKEGKVQDLVNEIREKNVEKLFSEQPGNVYFRYSVPVNEENMLYLTDVWETDADFEAHKNCNVTPIWAEIKDKYVTGAKALRYDA